MIDNLITWTVGILVALLVLLLFGVITMLSWNILAARFSLPSITVIEAVAIYTLAFLLFKPISIRTKL